MKLATYCLQFTDDALALLPGIEAELAKSSPPVEVSRLDDLVAFRASTWEPILKARVRCSSAIRPTTTRSNQATCCASKASIPHLNERRPIEVVNTRRDRRFHVRHDLSDRQVRIVLAGGLINDFRKREAPG